MTLDWRTTASEAGDDPIGLVLGDRAGDEGVMGIDAQGAITYANARAAALLGYGVAEMCGLDISVCLISPGDPEPLLGALRDGRIVHVTDARMCRKDGTCFPVECVATPLRNEGAIAGAILNFRDLTLRAQVVERFRDDVLSLLQHELRTPLHGITSFASLLDEGVAGPLGEEQKRYVEKVLHGTERMLFVINNLIDLARARRGEFVLEREQVPFFPLVAEVISNVKPLADKRGIRIEANIEVPGMVLLDRQRVAQVLVTLVGNAVRFSPDGERVTIDAFMYEQQLVTQVVDRGPGIAPERLATLFDGGRRGEDGSIGAGVGMAVSKAIVEAHGGRIEVLSQPGAGAMFSFTLPQAA